MRANAIPAKRSASPAIAAGTRQPASSGPSSTVSRPPNRLVANEAAKGLMKKQILPQPATSFSNDDKAVSPIPQTSLTDVSATTPTMPAIASPQITPQAQTQSLKPRSIDPKIANNVSTPPVQQSPPIKRQYHQLKVDADDLASASSDSEDEDDKPLAVRTQSPVKTHFTMEQIRPTPPATAMPVQTKITASQTMPGKATSPRLSKLAPKQQDLSGSGSTSASEASASDKESLNSTTKSRVDHKRNSSLSGNTIKRLSPDSASNSRASSPARSTGGPKTVAKTSGGSRLSRPVSKVSPRLSPKPTPAPVLAAESSTNTTTSSSASTSRPTSPSPSKPVVADAKVGKSTSPPPATAAAQLAVNTTPRASSRAPSPLPSPGMHPLPAKPPPSPSNTKSHASSHPSPSRPTSPLPAPNSNEQGNATKSLRPSLLPLGLPANPITGLVPNIPKSPSSSSLHPHSYHHHNHLHGSSSAAPSAHSTPGASPIVSHFPSSTSAAGNGARLSKSPNAGPLRTSTNGKRRDAPRNDLDKTLKAAAEDPALKKKKLNGGGVGAPSLLSNSTGSEEDGEAEEEEGEYKPPSDEAVQAKAENIRSEPVKAAPAKPTVNKSGLPSFTKKGRMSELKKGRDDSVPPRSQTASRANTPISHGSMDVDPPPTSSSSSSYKPRVSGQLHITNDVEFRRRTTEFQDKLYPEYTRLYAKLEDLKEGLSRNGTLPPHLQQITPQQIARMVDEVNERSQELERIKEGLWLYNDEVRRRNNATSRGSGSSGAMRVK